MRDSLHDYTEQEFLELLLESEADDFDPEKLDELVAFLNTKVSHPSGSDLIMYPTMLGLEDSSEAAVHELKRWYTEQGIPCFKV